MSRCAVAKFASLGMRRASARAAALAVILLSQIGAAPSAGASTQILEYIVEYPVLGTIGSYTNRIERRGDAVTVTSAMRVLVELAGVVLHREDADRVERWRGNRLVQFNGLTTVNGEAWPVRGAASGDHFIITTPEGTHDAPGDLQPANPWSRAFVRLSNVFAANTGTVEPGRVSGGEAAIVLVQGSDVQTRHYRVDSRRIRANVWLNERDVPVMMSIFAHGADIVLKLIRETSDP